MQQGEEECIRIMIVDDVAADSCRNRLFFSDWEKQECVIVRKGRERTAGLKADGGTETGYCDHRY